MKKSIAIFIVALISVTGCQQPIVEQAQTTHSSSSDKAKVSAQSQSTTETLSVNRTTITCHWTGTASNAQMRCHATNGSQLEPTGPITNVIPKPLSELLKDPRVTVVWNTTCEPTKIATIPCSEFDPIDFPINFPIDFPIGFPSGFPISLPSGPLINFPEGSGNFVSINVVNTSNTPSLEGTDRTPPNISFQITATTSNTPASKNGATIVWLVTDSESPITASSNCEKEMVINTDVDSSLTCTASSQGGSASQTVTIKHNASTSGSNTTNTVIHSENGSGRFFNLMR
jgi:hypothetical protein